MSTHQIRRRRRAARSSTSQGSAETLCARIKGANRDFSEGKLISDQCIFSFYGGQQGAANGQNSWGFFRDAPGLSTAGCWLTRRLHQLKASTTIDLDISISLVSVRCVALRNLGSFIKTDWSVICPLCC